jgi:predicted AlkP superfamily phosphohydrolase/phosphomutase
MTENLHDPWYELFLVFARDSTYRRILDRVLERADYDFVGFYLNGPDVASHYFWKYRFPDEWPEPIPADELAAGRDVIDRYYRYADELIGGLLEQAGDRCLVLLISDHGFVTGARPDSPQISGVHWNSAPPGVIVMAGGGLAGETKLDRGSVVDLAPTVLHALGLAVGRDMDGRVLPAVAALGPTPVRHVESYETEVGAGAEAPIPSEQDRAIIERLEALGYLDPAHE